MLSQGIINKRIKPVRLNLKTNIQTAPCISGNIAKAPRGKLSNLTSVLIIWAAGPVQGAHVAMWHGAGLWR